MSVGKSRHYRFDKIHARHFVQTAKEAKLSKTRAVAIIEEVAAQVQEALETAANALPADFPAAVVDVVQAAVTYRQKGLLLPEGQ